MSDKKVCYLVVNGKERDFRVLLRAELTQAEVTVLQIEVEAYRNHIKAMQRGLAPTTCYDSMALKDELCLAGHRLFYEKTDLPMPEKRSEDWPLALLLVVDDNVIGTIHEPDYKHPLCEQDLATIKGAKPSFDWNFFIMSFDGENYTMGFGALPMTKKILRECEEKAEALESTPTIKVTARSTEEVECATTN